MAAAKRYARAVFELAGERGEMDRCRQELKAMSAALREPAVLGLLRSPKVPFDQKRRVLEEKLKGLSTLVLNLASLLTLRGRLRLVDDLATEYGRLLDAHYGVEHVEVDTAVSLDRGELERLSGQLASALGKKVTVDSRVDPSLLGGLVAKVGDHLIDGSVRNRLELLRKGLAEAGWRS